MVTCGKCGRVATGTRLEAQWRREARPRKFRYACMACGSVMLVGMRARTGFVVVEPGTDIEKIEEPPGAPAEPTADEVQEAEDIDRAG